MLTLEEFLDSISTALNLSTRGSALRKFFVGLGWEVRVDFISATWGEGEWVGKAEEKTVDWFRLPLVGGGGCGREGRGMGGFKKIPRDFLWKGIREEGVKWGCKEWKLTCSNLSWRGHSQWSGTPAQELGGWSQYWDLLDHKAIRYSSWEHFGDRMFLLQFLISRVVTNERRQKDLRPELGIRSSMISKVLSSR